MLTQIDVVSENAFTLPILGVTTKAPLLIRSIAGLNPPDINLFVGDYSRDGGIYQGRRVGTRDVVFTIDLNPDPALGQTIASLRNDLYKAFIDPQVEGDYLQFVMHDDLGGQRYLVGYTEKFETDVFSVDTIAQITVLCPDPYIRDNYRTVVSNPTSGLITIPFTYAGTAEAGFEVEIFVDTNTSKLILDNNAVTDNVTQSTYWRGRMVVNKQINSGNVVYVNTNRGARNIVMTATTNLPHAWVSNIRYDPGESVSYNGKYWTNILGTSSVAPAEGPYWTEQDITTRWQGLIASGLTTPLIGSLDPNSRWIELHSQSNTMRVYGTDPGTIVGSIHTLVYTQAYWGV